MRTVEEVYRKAQQLGVADSISQDDWNRITDVGDLERLVDYKADYASAKNPSSRALASAGAENIRSKYGYSGDTSATVRELTQDYSTDEFDFDPTRSSAYRQAKKQFALDAAKAGEDALFSASSATGGIPSSYAVTAATQASGTQRAALAERLTELYDTELAAFNTRKAKEEAERIEAAAAQEKANRDAAEKARKEAEALQQKAQEEAAKQEKSESQKSNVLTNRSPDNEGGYKKKDPGPLYSDGSMTVFNGSQPIIYYANILQKMVDRGATNKEIRAYLTTLINDKNGLTDQDRALLIPAFWSKGA